MDSLSCVDYGSDSGACQPSPLAQNAVLASLEGQCYSVLSDEDRLNSTP